MSRSLQTEPRSIRAVRRTTQPWASRRDETVVQRRQARLLGAAGIEIGQQVESQTDSHRLRVRTVPARPGFIHPLGAPQIRDALAFFGPIASYGLRSIEMRQATDPLHAGIPILAELRVPGVIILYEQAISPWSIPGTLSRRSLERLRDAGAVVEMTSQAVMVGWPDGTLGEFMLFEGLMHEIGHHLVQHETGQREARVMRTTDHERRARRFARECREAWRESKA